MSDITWFIISASISEEIVKHYIIDLELSIILGLKPIGERVT